jgi:hypothetical protein
MSIVANNLSGSLNDLYNVLYSDLEKHINQAIKEYKIDSELFDTLLSLVKVVPINEIYLRFCRKKQLIIKNSDDYSLQSTTHFGIICVKSFINVHNRDIVRMVVEPDGLSYKCNTVVNMAVRGNTYTGDHVHGYLQYKYDTLFQDVFASTIDELRQYSKFSVIYFELIMGIIIVESYVNAQKIDINSVYSYCIDPELFGFLSSIEELNINNDSIPLVKFSCLDIFQLTNFAYENSNNIFDGFTCVIKYKVDRIIIQVLQDERGREIKKFVPNLAESANDIEHVYMTKSDRVYKSHTKSLAHLKRESVPAFTIDELYDSKFDNSSNIIREYITNERECLLFMYLSTLIYDKLMADLML